MKLTLNISPCPNDTFMFHAMLAGRIDTEGLEFDLAFADIEQLNEKITEGHGPQISKISYAILPLITERYALLRSGGALGRGNGPLMVSRKVVDPHKRGLSVAIPGIKTTANMLLGRIFPEITDKHEFLFSDITAAVVSGKVDAGVLIHESRFTYPDHGLHLVADLGREWEQLSGLPLPLGAIAVSRELSLDVQAKVERVMRRSVEYALANPEAPAAFVRSHAQELSPEVMRSHIEMFVNTFSTDLGPEGERAARELTGLTTQNIFIGHAR